MNRFLRSKWFIPTALAVLLAIAFFDVVFLNKTFKVSTANAQAMPYGVYGQEFNRPRFIPVNGTDSSVLEEPLYQFIKNSLWKGVLPLWNPHQACGYPLIGMIQTAMFYPLTWIMYLFPSIIAWDILILVRLLLAGILTFWFMRTMGFNKTPSVASAIAFMLSGPMVLLQYWTVNVDIVLPVLLIALERLIRERSPRSIAWVSVAVGLTFFGGHPEHIFLVNAYGAAFFIFRFLALPDARQASRGIGLSIASAYILGIGLSAMVLFPFLRNLFTEFWHSHPGGTGLMMEEQRARAITLALPHFFQREAISYQWVFAGWWGGYLGILPIGLSAVALFQNHKRRLNLFFIAMAVLLISKAYGLAFINWIGYLPLFNLPRYAIHTPPFAAFSIAVAAGMGVRAILARPRPALWQAAGFGAILMAVALGHLFIYRQAQHVELSVRAVIFSAGILIAWLTIIALARRQGRVVTSVCLIALLWFELVAYIHRERPTRYDSFPKIPYIELLKTSPVPVRSYGNYWAFYPNAGSAYGVDDLGYFLCMAPQRFVDFVNNLLIRDHFRNDFRSPALRTIPVQRRENFLDLLNVHYLILPATDAFIRPFPHFDPADKYARQVYHREVRVYERPHPMPRAFIVHRAAFSTDPMRTFQLLEQAQDRLRGFAVLEGPDDPTIIDRLNAAPLIDGSSARITRQTPNTLDLTVSMDHDGVLILSEAYHPEWRVYVNGRREKIYPADHLLRGVFLPAGRHSVRFVFHPLSFYLGLATTAATAIIIVLFFRRNLPSRKKKKGR